MAEDCVEIVPNMWLGSMWATDPKALKDRGINVVINVAGPESDVNRQRFELIEHLIFPCADTAADLERIKVDVIPAALDAMDQHYIRGRSILVHCVAGKSRSALVMTMWIARNFVVKANGAYQFIKEKKPNVQLNRAFEEYLTIYDDNII
jgi:protein-tyrosine phosphatase